MIPYYVIYSVLAIVAVLLKNSHREKKKQIFCAVSFIMIFALLALRHQYMGVDLGYDLKNAGYLNSFDILNSYSWSKILTINQFLNYERGYIIFNKLIGSIYNNRQFFMAVCAFINVFPVIIYIYKRSDLPLLSMYILLALPVFFIYFSGLRQGIAVSITLLSMVFIDKKKVVWFVLTVLFASIFHKSAITFLLAYPVYYIRVTDTWKLASILGIPVVFIFKEPLFRILSGILTDNAKIISTGDFGLFLVLCLVYVFLIVFDRDSNGYRIGAMNLFYIACLCQAFSLISYVALRVGYYFMIHLVIALPNTIASFREKGFEGKKEFVASYVVLTIIFILYGLSSLSNGNWARTNPYMFFWQLSAGYQS